MHWTHIALLSVCAFALWQKHEPITRAAIVFLANSAAMTLWAWFVDPVIDPRLQLAVDMISAYFIMRDPADREQAWLGLVFGVRIGASLAFVRAGVPEAAADYWQLLNYAGQALMIGLFLWSEGHGGKLARIVDRLVGFARHRLSRSNTH